MGGQGLCIELYLTGEEELTQTTQNTQLHGGKFSRSSEMKFAIIIIREGQLNSVHRREEAQLSVIK